MSMPKPVQHQRQVMTSEQRVVFDNLLAKSSDRSKRNLRDHLLDNIEHPGSEKPEVVALWTEMFCELNAAIRTDA